MRITTLLLSLAATALMGTSAMAQTAGEKEYMNACASCHGKDGTGNGPISRVISSDVPDLTVLAQNNDGKFPLLKVMQIIDGRQGVAAHGSDKPDWEAGMPVWGDRFQDEAIGSCGPYGAEVVVRGRIQVLADYIESIQK